MGKKAKIIVLDANILIRAVLGIRTFSLIAEHRDKEEIVAINDLQYLIVFPSVYLPGT